MSNHGSSVPMNFPAEKAVKDGAHASVDMGNPGKINAKVTPTNSHTSWIKSVQSTDFKTLRIGVNDGYNTYDNNKVYYSRLSLSG